LMKIKGEARGTHFKNDADFIIKEKGEDGLKNVEKELERFQKLTVGRELKMVTLKKEIEKLKKELEQRKK